MTETCLGFSSHLLFLCSSSLVFDLEAAGKEGVLVWFTETSHLYWILLTFFGMINTTLLTFSSHFFFPSLVNGQMVQQECRAHQSRRPAQSSQRLFLSQSWIIPSYLSFCCDCSSNGCLSLALSAVNISVSLSLSLLYISPSICSLSLSSTSLSPPAYITGSFVGATEGRGKVKKL